MRRLFTKEELLSRYHCVLDSGGGLEVHGALKETTFTVFSGHLELLGCEVQEVSRPGWYRVVNGYFPECMTTECPSTIPNTNIKLGGVI